MCVVMMVAWVDPENKLATANTEFTEKKILAFCAPVAGIAVPGLIVVAALGDQQAAILDCINQAMLVVNPA